MYACVTVNREQTVAVFEDLYRLVRNINNPGECTSVERCIFSHLFDLYTSDTMLKPAVVYDFVPTYGKIRQTIYSKVTITPSLGPWNVQWNTTFLSEVITNYRRGGNYPSFPCRRLDTDHIFTRLIGIPGRIDPMWLRQLNESQANRYSLVCNVMITLCNETSDVDRLNDLGILCAELTAGCNALTAEWLGKVFVVFSKRR